MEQLHEQQETINELETARFNEKLAEEHEADWQQLVEHIHIVGDDPANVLVPMWADSEVPTAFRDRAMLYLVAEDNAFRAGSSYPELAFMRSGPDVLEMMNSNPCFDSAAFGRWFSELIAHETKRDETLLSVSRRIDWALRLYDEESITDETLDAALEQYDISRVLRAGQGHYFTRGVFDSDDRSYLPINRFNILEDVLSSEFGPTRRGPQFLWAVKKLHQWISAQEGDSGVEVPEWVSEAGRGAGRELHVRLCRELASSRSNTLEWSDVAPGIHHFGWSVIEAAHIFRDGSRMGELLNIIDNAEDQVAYVQFVFTANNAKKLLGDDYAQWELNNDFLQQAKDIVPASDHETHQEIDAAFQRLAIEEKRVKAYRKEYKQERLERERERAEEDRVLQEKRTKAARDIAVLMTKIRQTTV